MDLRNKLTHMHGMSVNVNGTRYAILPDGVARDIKDDDAKKLLQNEAWSIYTQRQPVKKLSIPAPAPEPKDESEWPDPDESMDIDYLREMADAYEVKYTIRSAKAILIKHIMMAMYPDGK